MLCNHEQGSACQPSVLSDSCGGLRYQRLPLEISDRTGFLGYLLLLGAGGQVENSTVLKLALDACIYVTKSHINSLLSIRGA